MVWLVLLPPVFSHAFAMLYAYIWIFLLLDIILACCFIFLVFGVVLIGIASLLVVTPPLCIFLLICGLPWGDDDWMNVFFKLGTVHVLKFGAHTALRFLVASFLIFYFNIGTLYYLGPGTYTAAPGIAWTLQTQSPCYIEHVIIPMLQTTQSFVDADKRKLLLGLLGFL